MKRRIVSLIFLLFVSFSAVSQETEVDEKLNDFMLIPILETVFSGNLRWSPDWPVDIPPDSFFLLKENVLPEIIELSNEGQNYLVRRDSEGRLVEFPFFLSNGYAKVETTYEQTGAIKEMFINFWGNEDDDEENVETEENPTQSDEEQGEQKTWRITFPVDFLPYSKLSPGGSFSPLTVYQDEEVFYIFIFESPGFLTETWYSGEGEMLLTCKAIVDHENLSWRVRYLQIHDSRGIHFVDYFFDSSGNVTEVRIEGGGNNGQEYFDNTFSAVYRNRRPVLWQMPGLQYDLQWDTQGILTIIKAAGEAVDIVTEYRYEYERDAHGNWLKRQETAYGSRFGVLAPYLPGSRGTWNRRIVFFEDGGEE